MPRRHLRIDGRHLDTSKDLTYAEADAVIQRLRAFDAAGATAFEGAVDRWLGEYGRTDQPAEDAEEQP
jgi:hypothetical protein